MRIQGWRKAMAATHMRTTPVATVRAALSLTGFGNLNTHIVYWFRQVLCRADSPPAAHGTRGRCPTIRFRTGFEYSHVMAGLEEAGDAALVPAGPHPRQVGGLRPLGGGPAQARGADLPRDGHRPLRHRPRGVGPGRGRAGQRGPRRTARRAPPAHRTGLLRWPHLSRGRSHAEGARGHGEESHPVGARAPPGQPGRTGRRAGRGGTLSVPTTPTVPEPGHQEIQDLLGAYALDAVDPDTASMVEAHLEHCARCAVEVAQHHEVAGLLANSGGSSPARVWDGIARRLEVSAPPSWTLLAARLEAGQGEDKAGTTAEAGGEWGDGLPAEAPVPASGVVPISSSRRRQGPVRVAGAVAAAVAAVALIFGVQADHLGHQETTAQAPLLSAAEQQALASPTSE